jgi:3-oxoacyl-[acyl-carrier protein] reductase
MRTVFRTGHIFTAETRDLTGTIVAVTGASSGIGAATARLLVGAGARVTLQARRKERLDELVAELGDDRAVGVAGDVQDPAAATALVAAAVEAFGQLDSIVINAGIGMYGGILDRTDDELQTMMRTNLEGTVWSARTAVRHFRGAGAGDIVIVASVAGLRGGADEAVYAATKFAQVGFAGALDREVRTDGIRVTAICPAGVETEFALGTGRTEADPALADYLRPDDIAYAITTVLRQPRRVRTTQWQLWSMGQSS